MFIVSIDKNNVKMAEKEMVTSGSINAYECQFVFSDEWEKMTKTVTFKAGEKTISVTLDEENKCVIPWEVLSVADVDLYVGVIGAAGAETEDPTDDVVMPTVWGHMGTVRHGTTEGENTEIPTPSAYERIMIEINTIKNDIKDINNTFDGGEVGQVWTKTEDGEGWADGGAASAPSIGDNGNWYIGDTDTGVKAAGTDGINGENGQDGFSPTVDVTTIEGGHKVTITDKNGDQSFDVMNGNDGSAGADGADGFSPIVAITEIENGYNLAITDKNGTQSVDITNGTNGTNGTDGFSPIVEVTEIEGGHMVTITDASGPHSFIVTNGTGGEGGGGVSPVVDITEISGGYRLTITDATGSHSADIMNGINGTDGADGADGFSPTVAITEINNGHKVTITDKNGDQAFDVMNGTDGQDGSAGADGADGFSPTVDVTTIEGGHKVTITDKNGNQVFDVMDGTDGNDGATGATGADGFSPTVDITEIEGGHTVTITDATGSHSANIMNGNDGNDGSAGADGADGFSPTVDITTIEGGHNVTITDKDGAKSFDVTNGANGANGADGKDGEDGFSPVISVENIDGGHKVTITDKNGDQAFNVMNGADGSAGATGADGKAATIRIGTVTEGDTPAVTNSGTNTDAVFDFVLPSASGSSGGAEYSMVKASSVANTINTAEYNLTKDGSTIGSAIEIPKSMRDICMGKVTPTHLASGAPSSVSWIGPSNGTLSLKSPSTVKMKVAALYSEDVLGSSLVGCDYVLPRYIDFKVTYANTSDTADYNLAYITIKYEKTIHISDAYGQNVYVSGFNGEAPIKMGFISVNRSSNMVIKANGVETNSVPCYCVLSTSTTTWGASIYPIGNVTISNSSGFASGSFRVTLAI